MAPSISIRESIRWLPDPASEPTSTLVLTSAQRRFVDLRIYKPASATTERSRTDGSLPATFSEALYDASQPDVLPLTRLEWAIAGTSGSRLREPREGEGQKKIVHSTWWHWIDSRTREPEKATDEGDMFPQPGEERTLEKGHMVNPATGVDTEYEEMWFEVEPEATGEEGSDSEGTAGEQSEATTAETVTEATSGVGDLTGDEDDEDDDDHDDEDYAYKGGEEDIEGNRSCVVLVLQDDDHEARGLIVRVGQFVQGLLRVGKQLALERWEWKGIGEGWRRQVRMGDMWLPCAAAIEEARLELGGEVKHGDYMWKVIEHSKF